MSAIEETPNSGYLPNVAELADQAAERERLLTVMAIHRAGALALLEQIPTSKRKETHWKFYDGDLEFGSREVVKHTVSDAVEVESLHFIEPPRSFVLGRIVRTQHYGLPWGLVGRSPAHRNTDNLYIREQRADAADLSYQANASYADHVAIRSRDFTDYRLPESQSRIKEFGFLLARMADVTQINLRQYLSPEHMDVIAQRLDLQGR